MKVDLEVLLRRYLKVTLIFFACEYPIFVPGSETAEILCLNCYSLIFFLILRRSF